MGRDCSSSDVELKGGEGYHMNDGYRRVEGKERKKEEPFGDLIGKGKS